MRTVIISLLCIVCLGAGGCAKRVWTHASKGQVQFYADSNECEYEAEKATSYYAPDMSAMFGQATQKNKLYGMCMQNKGWYLTDEKASFSKQSDVPITPAGTTRWPEQ